MLLLAGSLEKMLAGHNQSMFEYLASGRGGGGAVGGGQAAASSSYFSRLQQGMLPIQAANANRGGGQQKNEGFKDIVY